MRGGVVAAGVLMMIIGAGLIFILPAIIQSTGGAGASGIPIAMWMGPIIGGLGFLVFIAGLAASPPQKPQPVIVQQSIPPAMAPETLVICPECHERVSAKSKFCPECGEDMMPKQKEKFIKVKPVEPEEKLEPAKKTKLLKKAGFCMYCGAELHEVSEFCHKCGKAAKKAK